MAQKAAPVVVTKLDDGFEFKLVGDVAADLSTVEAEIQRVLAAKPKRVLVDLGACQFISSAGMGALVKFYSAIRANGGTLKIVKIQKMVYGAFRIGRLDQLLGISPEAIV